MSHSTEAERLTELIRWHIMRADGQRQGFWMRAAAVLSADALVIAGTAVLASTSSKAAWWSLATSALPLTAAMISIFEAISVIGGVRNWAYKFTEFNSPAPILYSLPETVRHFGDYEKFRETVMSRSAFELQTVFDALVKSATHLCHASASVIWRPKDDGRYHLAASYGVEPRFEEQLKSLALKPDGHSVVGRSLQSGKTTYVSDLMADPDYAGRDVNDFGGYRGLLCVPLLRDGVASNLPRLRLYLR